MSSSFPNRWSFSYLKFTKYVTNIIAEPKYKHTARTSNSKELQQKYRLGTVSIKILGGGLNRFYGYPTSPSASIMALNIQLFGPREGFLTHQWIITGNKLITDKYYDEAKMRTRQKRVATDTWRSLGCRTTPLEHWSKRKPTIEPRWAKQQTKKLRPKPTKINSFMSGPSLSLTLWLSERWRMKMLRVHVHHRETTLLWSI